MGAPDELPIGERLAQLRAMLDALERDLLGGTAGRFTPCSRFCPHADPGRTGRPINDATRLPSAEVAAGTAGPRSAR